MTTTNRVLLITFLFAGIFFIACEEPIDCHYPTEPTITEPILIAYFDALEQVLYYAEEYENQVITDPHILDWEGTGGRYAGYSLAGEAMTYEVGLISVPAADLPGLSNSSLAIFSELLASGVLDVTTTAVPSRRHIFRKCGELEEGGLSTCENVTDSTSIERKYNDFRRCTSSTSSSDECTEFEVLWYTEIDYDKKDCASGGGAITRVQEHKD